MQSFSAVRGVRWSRPLLPDVRHAALAPSSYGASGVAHLSALSSSANRAALLRTTPSGTGDCCYSMPPLPQHRTVGGRLIGPPASVPVHRLAGIASHLVASPSASSFLTTTSLFSSSSITTTTATTPASRRSLHSSSPAMSSQPEHATLLIPGPIEFDDAVLNSMSHYRLALLFFLTVITVSPLLCIFC